MITQNIKTKLENELAPEYLNVIDESAGHASHYAQAASGETHFLIEISASSLDHLSTLQKHKRIYTILEDEIKKIHAISIRFRKAP